MTFDLDKWREEHDDPATSSTWKLRDLEFSAASSSIYRLYKSLNDWEGISGWCGPLFQFGGGYENYYGLVETDAQSTFVRHGALVMTLFAAWCAIEEWYVLSDEVALELEARLKSVSAIDDTHSRLLKITKRALEIELYPNDDSNWGVWRLSTESSWVLNEIVRPALSNGSAE